ncbi:methyl-accepting chemotaxis protein [Enterovibrio makurazakiensis]|uniref:Methyl-accepting chemotaxis protein n=1 Tax=Enterovibrio gelatinilyticus TaxID=2899819 RepID=A0ABT5R3S1_9GAMM|nr:PAS domain-containing methyl-accepting chemotaxis protein [Enterovibrio sp. ZSDZ42]MDD1794914.1 methyl-accepting chemotaxis protein [Enterovibrio sp. ZSDZ42]
MRINNPVTEKEVRFPIDYNLLSTTDTRGIIKYVSKEFCEVAGYTQEELVGQPHNMVRHPSMPPAAFENMWDYIKSGRSWMGLVKNRSSNGDHYWVNAFASPIKKNGEIVEYQSVRMVPDRKSVERAEKVYPQLLAGKTPSALKMPRTRLWQRALIWFVLGAILAGAAGFFAGFVASVAVQLVVSVVAIFMLTRRLEAVTSLAKEAYDNPLMEYLYNGAIDDVSEIELALKMRAAELNAIVGRIMDGSDQVLNAASTAKENGERTAGNLDRQNAETDQIAAAINQMSATANDMSGNTQSASDAALEAQDATLAGMETVGKTVDAIQNLAKQLNSASSVISELEEHGKRIGAVSDVIQGIAEQTNLLALNAAIEAARAGEQGRGFAVVADEVRALAQRTQESTSEIQDVISKIQNGTQQAVDAMSRGTTLSEECVVSAEQAGDVLRRSQELVTDINDRNHQIATAVQEQAAVSNEMNGNIQSVSELSQHTISISRESVEEAERLFQALAEQKRLVMQFRRIG